MLTKYIEEKLPSPFRKQEIKDLLNLLCKGNSVEIVGIKKIGISSFLKFFLINSGVSKLLRSKIKDIFLIPVDMTDLADRSPLAFWRLTFKRILDQIEQLNISPNLKEQLNSKFITSIQLDDIFYTKDSVTEAITKICELGFTPLLIFIGFDRIEKITDETLVDNLIGMREASGHRLLYIFTSYRSLMSRENVANKSNLGMFISKLFLNPLNNNDRIVYIKNVAKKLMLRNFPKEHIQTIAYLSGGSTNYIQTIILFLTEAGVTSQNLKIERILEDERVFMHSEEIFYNLPEKSQMALQNFLQTQTEIKDKYLKNLGVIYTDSNGESKIFSPIFESFLKIHFSNQMDESILPLSLTKKELLLYELLKTNLNKVVNRPDIISHVWFEYTGFGVSDWSIDRLVARLRKKLIAQQSKYSIETIRTRGFIMK
jgi:hypothetical protein